jgi:3,4-dihydroxy 2-butanone 4-phosphate synthase/GTP cyclohydrolase II
MATKQPPRLQLIAETDLPTEFGAFRILAFDTDDNKEHLALIHGDVAGRKNVLTRVQSECLTGEVFHSMRCDCKAQLHSAMKQVAKEGGIVVYMRQEGRGVGLVEKLKAYSLQDKGADTFQANRMLGHADDLRTWEISAAIIQFLQVRSIRLLTNNPDKIFGLKREGVEVSSRAALQEKPNEFSQKYLQAKKDLKGHLL